jgi:hypothetical protein
MFFNRVDQLGNADRLRDEWMPLDMKPTICLTVRYQRCREDDHGVVSATEPQ